ncbi:MAG: SH3 domain-containing protein [Nitrospira sp.]|nr:SH3 domain-containing protein [bacterium]MBL7049499.1 SH3 domain-containing protein [Nitrospira sp.]
MFIIQKIKHTDLKRVLALSILFILWAFIPSITLAAESTTVEITAKRLNVRSLPDSGSEVIDKVLMGDHLDASVYDNTWLMITTKGNRPGFIVSRFAKAASGALPTADERQQILVEITARRLNVRSLPSSSAGVAGKYTEGMRLNAVVFDDKWFMVITSLNRPGFIARSFAKIIMEEPVNKAVEIPEALPEKISKDTPTASSKDIFTVVITVDSLIIRSAPDKDSAILGHFKKGEQVTATPYNDKWMTVKLNDILQGYIYSKFTELKNLTFITEPEKPILTPASTPATANNCNAETIKLDLLIGDVTFKCDESLLRRGFAGCAITIDTDVTSNCLEEIAVTVLCETEISYFTETEHETTESKDTASKTVKLLNGQGETTLQLYWSSLSPALGAKLNNVSCIVTDVQDR